MHGVIVIGTSAGGLDALKMVLSGLPPDLNAAVLVVMHIGARPSILPQLLTRVCPLPVRHARDGEPALPAQVLIAPPDCHLLLHDGHVALSHGPKENHTRPAIDPLFRTAAEACMDRVIGVVLTGYLDDGAAGLQAIKACGGVAIVQDPSAAFAPDMPANALARVAVDMQLMLHEIAPALAQLVASLNRLPAEPTAATVPEWVAIENHMAAHGATIDELSQIAFPSTYTCPECRGTLWEVRGAVPKRFRCHTGHSYTARALGQLQQDLVESAIWSAVQALQEREVLARDLAAHARTIGEDDTARMYEKRAEMARENANVLQQLVVEGEPEG